MKRHKHKGGFPNRKRRGGVGAAILDFFENSWLVVPVLWLIFTIYVKSCRLLDKRNRTPEAIAYQYWAYDLARFSPKTDFRSCRVAMAFKREGPSSAPRTWWGSSFNCDCFEHGMLTLTFLHTHFVP